MTYQEFLQRKALSVVKTAGGAACYDINPILKPHQAAIVRWMVEGGRRACFAAFGLGKTVIQLETVRIVREREGGRGLIILPLGVRAEFIHDAAMLGIKVKFIRRIEEAEDPDGIYLTNYAAIAKASPPADVSPDPEIDHTDDPCPCGDPDCSRPFGHPEEEAAHV